jgi:hypothetical protein
MKQRTIVFWVIGALLITAVIFAMRNNSIRNGGKQSQQNPQTSQSPNIPVNIFTLTDIKIGDKIAGMTVQSITPYDEGVKTLPLESNAKVRFTGQTNVAGTYYYECPGFEGKCNKNEQRLCLKDLDEASQKKMPRIKNGRDPIWFCFSNADEAKKLLAPNTGKESVLIDNYILNVYPSEVIDTADLIKVE